MMKDRQNVEGEQSFTLTPLVSRTPPSVTPFVCAPLSHSLLPLFSVFFPFFLSFLLLNGNIIIEDSTS